MKTSIKDFLKRQLRRLLLLGGVKQFGVNYPVVMGDPKIVQDFGGIAAIPTTFVIDRSGKVLARHVGYVPKETFEKQIIPFL
jgi:thioredoxin-related protein